MAIEAFRAEVLSRLGQPIRADGTGDHRCENLTRIIEPMDRHLADAAAISVKIASAVAQRSRLDDAELRARALLEIYWESGSHRHSPVMGMARARLGEAMVARGRWRAAIAQFEAIDFSPSRRPWAYHKDISANLSWALALAGGGRLAEARPIAQRAVERHRDLVGEQHLFTAESRGVLAITLALEGDIAGAIAEFKAAAPFLRSRWRPKRDDDLTQAAKNQRVDLILEAYLDILARNRNPANFRGDGFDAITESYRAASLAHGIRFSRNIGARRRTERGGDSHLARELLLRIARLKGALDRIQALPSAQRDFGAAASLAARIGWLRTKRARIRRQANRLPEGRGPRAYRKPEKLEDVRARLGPGETMIAAYIGADRAFVWAIPKLGLAAFAAAPLSRREIATAVSACGGLVSRVPNLP